MRMDYRNMVADLGFLDPESFARGYLAFSEWTGDLHDLGEPQLRLRRVS